MPRENCGGYEVGVNAGGVTQIAAGKKEAVEMEPQAAQENHTPDRDKITGLNDHQSFRDKLVEITKGNQPWGIMIFGIDNFKHINDLYSYSFGDQVLKDFAWQIRKLVEDMRVYRLDGDGFGLLHPDEHPEFLMDGYRRILRAAEEPRTLNGINISFTISAGMCFYPEHGRSFDDLYKNARLALTQAKQGSKKKCVLYNDEMSEKLKRDMLIQEKLRQSVENGFEGFHLLYQPIMRNDTKKLYGCEALLRWENPAFLDGVSPYIFIPMLEASGLIHQVGRWVIDHAFEQCAKWLVLRPDFQMNVNASARQLDDRQFTNFIMEMLKKHRLNPRAITIELTESGRVDFAIVKDAFNFLRKQGIKIAFDDFGTGYSSLDVFRSVSGDELKIDKSFLERITYDVTDQALLKSIIDMCRSMDIMVCVEGIENAEIEHTVSLMSPHLLQGYLYDKPVSAEEFTRQYFAEYTLSSMEDEDMTDILFAGHRPVKPMSLSEIVDNAYAGIFQMALDKDMTFLTCNEGYRRILGYTAREMEEKFSNKVLGFVYPDDADWVNNEIRRQLEKGDTISIEFRVVRSDGQVIWIIGTGNLVRSADGTPSLIFNIIDNHERKQKILQKIEECILFDHILGQLPTGILYMRYDPDLTIEYISQGFLALLGYAREEISEKFGGRFIHLIYVEDQEEVLMDMMEQIKSSDVITLRYRAVCKDGSLLWLETVARLCPQELDGIYRCCSSVVNVTDIIYDENKKQSLNVANQFQIAAQRWGDVIFEYNFKSGMAVFSSSYRRMFGYQLQDDQAYMLDLVHEDDRDTFLKLVGRSLSEKNPPTEELRLVCREEGREYLWCRVTVINPSQSLQQKAVSAIGRIANIDKEHKEHERLKRESQIDSLTRLLNKGALERRIKEVLNKSQDRKFALFVLDVDEFKFINDNYGHFNGDIVLRTVASRLKEIYRKEDVIGRAGGDEYMVLMQYNGDIKVLRDRGHMLVERLNEPIMLEGKGEFRVSFSVGISRYPEDGVTFADLFQKADSALYIVKRKGKNNFHISE